MGVDNPVLRKSLITLASGGIGYLLTTFAKQPVIWSLTMSIFIGGVSLVVQFLLDFDARVRQLDGRFHMVNQATELFGRVESGNLRTETVVELVQIAAEVPRLGNPLATRFADDLLVHQTEVLRQLVHQQVADHPGDDLDWLLMLTARAEKSLKATTMIGPSGQPSVDDAFWDTQLAETYLHLQREAKQRRGVRVQRLFIVPPGWQANERVIEIIKRNRLAEVEVRVLDARPTGGIIEFILFDDEVCQEFPVRQTVSGEPAYSPTTQLRLKPQAVQRRIDQFDAWWAAATPDSDNLPE
jgi:hypothetical protein